MTATLSVLLLALPPGVHRTEDGRYVSGVDGAELVRVEGGERVLGDDAGRYDERPRLRVRLRPFLIDRAEVTNERFANFVQATGYRPQGPWARGFLPGRAAHPVRFVTWFDAHAYARWAGRRLPTEAEWETAAGPHRYPWGDRWQPDRAVTGRAPERGPEPAGRALDSTPGGVLNMAGNVREWVADWYDRFTYEAYAGREPVVDPRGPASGTPPEARFVATETEAGNERSTRKGVRGASWAARHPDLARRARRGAENPRHFYDDVGFRCAISLGRSR